MSALARGLLGLGVERGEHVGIWSTDNAEWVLVQLATARIGAVLVNVNPACRAAELRYALEHARIRTLFFIPAFRRSDYVATLLEVVPEAADEGAATDLRCAALPELRRLVVYDPARAQATRSTAPGFLAWSDVLERGASVSAEQLAKREAALDFDDPINIQFTSGTTGHPKAVVLTHHNILNNARFIAEALDLGATDRVCVPVPFYHCFGMVVSNLVCLAARRGRRRCLRRTSSAGATLRAIQRAERCTARARRSDHVHRRAARACDDFEQYAASRALRTGHDGGGAVSARARAAGAWRTWAAAEILIGYGQTEASPGHAPDAMRTDSFELRHGTTVGRQPPAPGSQGYRRGAAGSSCVRGRQARGGVLPRLPRHARLLRAARRRRPQRRSIRGRLAALGRPGRDGATTASLRHHRTSEGPRSSVGERTSTRRRSKRCYERASRRSSRVGRLRRCPDRTHGRGARRPGCGCVPGKQADAQGAAGVRPRAAGPLQGPTLRVAGRGVPPDRDREDPEVRASARRRADMAARRASPKRFAAGRSPSTCRSSPGTQAVTHERAFQSFLQRS